MEEMNNKAIFSAPIQGLTETAWRHFHHMIYGDGITRYHTPFLRVERGEIRRRDLRDLGSDFNKAICASFACSAMLWPRPVTDRLTSIWGVRFRLRSTMGVVRA